MVIAVQHFSVGFGHSAVYGSEFPFEWFSGHLCGVSTDQLRRKPHVLHRTVPGGGQYRKCENCTFMSVHAVGGSQHGLFGLQSQWTQGAEKSLWRVPPASAQFVHNGDVGCNGSNAFPGEVVSQTNGHGRAMLGPYKSFFDSLKDGMVFHHAVLCLFVRFPVGLDGGGLIILYLFCVDLRSYFSRSSRMSAPKLAAVMRRQSPSGNGSAV